MHFPITRGRAAAAAIFLLFALFILLDGPWRPAAEDWSSGFYTRLRGDRPLDERCLFIAITTEDLRDLGGWPFTRDYYGYLLHALHERGARVIALDLLLSTAQSAYPEFDRFFADGLEAGSPVCLPMAFGEFLPPGRSHAPLFQAGQPQWPYAPFRSRAAGCGFSNLPPAAAVQRLPVLALEGDTLRLAFGAEIARQFWGGRPFAGSGTALLLTDDQGHTRTIPLDGRGQLHLNPLSGRHILRLDLVTALRRLRDQPQSLDLAGKIVFIGVTAPGLAVSKSTPLNPAMPGSLLQLITAENIISGRWLRPLPVVLQLLLTTLLSAGLLLAARRGGWGRLALSLGLFVILLLAAGYLLFHFQWILPLIYPLGALLTSAGGLALARLGQERRAAGLIQRELQAAVADQNHQLQVAREELAALERQTAAAGEQAELFVKQQEVAELEQRLADAGRFARPERVNPLCKYDMLYHPDSPMAEVVRLIELLAAADLSVILEGETGTGKELAAQAIHLGGPRREAPFLAVNCGALPETLLESELFGHEKGSFTGAIARRRGLFELADVGTLFLDEISETSPAFQAKLLRVLQEKRVQRLGGEAQISVNVRIIAASNRSLPPLVEANRFRQDLYYRLNGMTLTLPPLRQRIMDIPILAEHFLAADEGGGPSRLAAEAGGSITPATKTSGSTTPAAEASGSMTMAAEVQSLLAAYAWPGNIRELQNVLSRAALLAAAADRNTILASDLPEGLRLPRPAASNYLSIEEQILHSLRHLQFSHTAIARTAAALGGRDRGTITEYFRGLCFQQLAESGFRIEAAARTLAASSDPEIVGRVARKMRAYVAHITAAADKNRLFNGLPQKYHPWLRQLLEHRDRIV